MNGGSKLANVTHVLQRAYLFLDEVRNRCCRLCGVSTERTGIHAGTWRIAMWPEELRRVGTAGAGLEVGVEAFMRHLHVARRH